MAELATIARPYAEAMFKATEPAQAGEIAAQIAQLGEIARDAQLRQFADSPKVNSDQVHELVAAVVARPLADSASRLLRLVIDNGRLAALPEIARQFQALVNARSGVAEATIESAFEIDAAQLASIVATLEKRFGRRLNAKVVIDPSLIGGIRVIVGDEVLDTSVKARLGQMKVALTA